MKRFSVITIIYWALAFMMSGCSHTAKNYPVVTSRQLSSHWFISSSDSTSATGKQISTQQFHTNRWYAAKVPTTVLHVLVQHGVYKNIFKNENLKKIPKAPFQTAWWYRTEFSKNTSGKTILLAFKGINYKANIWLNGKQIADTTQVNNTFLQYTFDISKQMKKGKNVLAVEVFPPHPGDFSMGFVDWNPKAPDGDMGIFRPVFLQTNNGVDISRPFITTRLSPDNSSASLTASVRVTNYTTKFYKGDVILKVDGDTLSKKVSLRAGEIKNIIFTPEEFPSLRIKHPKLWWPYTLGTPYLCKATFAIRHGADLSDEQSVNFGIRTVSDFYTKKGFRGFKINGKKILIRGGGWADHLLLDDTPESYANQLDYVKNMGLNTIRLEGFWGTSEALYSLCDRKGILVMAGWSCQWEWEGQLGKPVDEKFGGIISDKDVNLMSRAWKDQILWLRNHPAIFAWFGGSDKIPSPKAEKKYLQILSQYDTTRIYLPSAKEWTSTVGPSAVKMRGPYAYEPPVYWYEDISYGGAFGFNTETGPGAQVPPLASLKKMFSQKNLWPIDSVWNYHCARHAFGTLDRYTKALYARYGKATSAADYAQKAQVMNYELMRPMFEAFSANRYKATGVIQWMLNSAWPKMYWQLYDYYLMPTGAYYGAQKASRPYHMVYDYAHHTLFAVNDKLADLNHCTLRIRVYDTNSRVQYEKAMVINLKANSSRKVWTLPQKNWHSPVYFLDLRLFDTNGKEIDNNFYWLSTRPDQLNYKAKVPGWYFYTPSKQYANFKALNRLPKAEVFYSLKQEKQGKITLFKVSLQNNVRYLAFFVHLAITDKNTGKIILPVLWSDNYVSLLPGEKRVITATLKNKDLQNRIPQLTIEGYNLSEAKKIIIHRNKN